MNLRQTLERIVRIALEEDVESGDVTARYFCDPQRKASATIITRESCVLAGMDAAVETFRQVDENISLRGVKKEGDRLSSGDVALEIKGSVASILTGERTALNFIQRLAGIATLTRRFVDAVEGTQARILDTRKTTPGLRLLEKAAVRAGGGVNHRIGLYDMAMVKDNYFAPEANAAFVQHGIDRLKAECPDIKVEVEADRLDQVGEFLNMRGVDRILLDNMTPEDMKSAVKMTAGRVELEASGGICLENVRQVAETGVDFISIGALTHSAKAIDFSLEIGA